MYIWGVPKIVVPQNGWFIMENPTKVDDLVVPPFKDTPIFIYIYTIPWEPTTHVTPSFLGVGYNQYVWGCKTFMFPLFVGGPRVYIICN